MRRLAELIGALFRTLARIVGTCLWLVGLPVALIVFVGSPLPTAEELSGWPETAFTGPMMLRYAGCIGWLAWALLVYLLVTSLAARIAGVRLPRLRLPAALNTVLIGVVGAAAVPSGAGASPPLTAPTAITPTGLPTAKPAAKPDQHDATFLIAGQRYHVIVRKGDTLSRIAREWLGDGDRWPEICRLNQHRHWRVGGTLRDCNVIYPRWDLRLPADAKPPAGARRVDTPAPARRTPQPVQPKPTGPTAGPSQVTTTPAQAQTSPSASANRVHGLELPSGWLLWATAIAVLGLYAATLLRRRARRTPPAGLPVLIRQITQNPRGDVEASDDLEWPQDGLLFTGMKPDGRHDEAGPHEMLLERAAADIAAPAALGRHHGDIFELAALPRRGVGLTGPGTDASMRGLLASLLTSDRTGSPLRTPHVVVTVDLLTRIGPAGGWPPRVTATGGTDEALRLVQRAIHHRFEGQESASVASDSLGEGPLVAMMDAPQGEAAIRLAALADLGHPHGVHVIVAGAWPEGVTWTVATDGQVASDDGTTDLRLGHLDRAVFDELLAIADEHDHPGEDEPGSVAVPQAERNSPVGQFRLDVLGEVRLTSPAGEPVRIVRSGTKQIATLLAIHPDGCDRDDLLDLVFGHVRRKTAAGSLNTCVSELRSVLRSPATGDSGLLTVGTRYRLDPERVSVDWWQFNRLVEAGDFPAALELDRGPLAGDRPWDSLTEHREYIRARVALARKSLPAQGARSVASAG